MKYVKKLFEPTEVSFIEKLMIHMLFLGALTPPGFYTWLGL